MLPPANCNPVGDGGRPVATTTASSASASPEAPASFSSLLLQQHQTALSSPPVASAASSGGALAAVGRACYTPRAMVELMVTRPDYSHAMLAAHFGRPSSWLVTVIASEAFQLAVDPFRAQIADPSLTATLHERYKALAIRTSNVMMEKLDSKEVTDFMVLKSGEIAMKALGMGTKTEAQPAAVPAAPATDSLAERLMAALDRREASRTVDGAATVVDSGDDEESPHGNI